MLLCSIINELQSLMHATTYLAYATRAVIHAYKTAAVAYIARPQEV
ncbi:predicted protein [Plenodomus lingam JN3]|uniref:Predicted protein n=1 Tax=Leptosphaeria maculans (strain JN3 / isolate v23.1.3 / race Av1-4-5-6-7-8) TaxID=985895 RepID=E5R513_LEPMJ|nr:predicted protein [Plenodomus lingam JN3]CBX92286.1 predicted protein [Plenodomus lingam JN3]